MRGFPKGHLIIASGIAVISALPLLLLPAGEGAQARVEIPLELPATNFEKATSLPASRAPATSAAVKLPAPRQRAPQPPASLPSNPLAEPDWQVAEVHPGDNLSLIFQRLGLGAADVYEAANAGPEAKRLKRLLPGQQLKVKTDRSNKLTKLVYEKSLLESLTINRQGDVLISEFSRREPEIQTSFATGAINQSLFMDAKAAGLSDRKIMELAGIFGWDIDFALDLRGEDRFGVLYENQYLDGKEIGEGAILAAFFINQGREFTAVRYARSDGSADYFSPDGESMRKAFLRTPVDYARISSHFNLKRRHPILHTLRAHKGVDYAAARGTPIRSAGDGKIRFAGRKGGYGKTLIIQHGETYSTLYAHLKSFRRGIRNGTRVRQGQIIGYVGSSGLATGPHLHYEFRVNGVHRNPVTVKLPKSTPVPRKEMPQFVDATRGLVAEIQSLRSSQLALND